MRRIRLAGLNCRNILPKTLDSFLEDGPTLPYNWSQKLRGVVLGICLARSAVLQDIARTREGRVKENEKKLSEFLSAKRLDLKDSSRQCAVRTLRRIGKRRFFRYRGKLILIVDSTTYVKMRSRGKEQRMPLIGQIRLHNMPTSETLLVPGYNELWTGLLLKDMSCLGITRRLFTELMSPGFSQNALEEVEIERAIELVREAFGLDVIVVADRGFRRKDLLEWLKKELKTDFVIRLDGKLRVKARGFDSLLSALGPHWPERLRRFWRDTTKEPILSAIRGSGVTVAMERRRRLGFNVACLTPINREMEPLFLGTTLPIETRDELSMLVTLYSARWTIETFFYTFKQSLGAGRFRVFSCWEAVDRLLAMAHMALLVLCLMFIEGQQAEAGIWRSFWERVELARREWFARPLELTLGEFFRIVAIEFAQRRRAWEAP